MEAGRCVGRERELGRLGRRVAAAARGNGGLVVVRGPVGIGKSTVAAACMQAAEAAGGTSYLVAAPPTSGARPVALWARLAELVAATEPVPDVLVAGAVGNLHPHARYAAVLSLVRSLGPAPVVVVLDDLHRADESSAAILAQLAPALATTDVLVIATWRGAATPTAPAALDALAPWSEILLLGSLDEAGVCEVAAAVSGDDAWAAEVAPVLAERSRGNPLVLRAILDDPRVSLGARPTAGELRSMALDHAVADVVERRLGALPPTAAELVQAMALLGGEVPPPLLGDVLMRDPRRDLDIVLDAGVVEPRADGTVAFFHPALPETAVARAAQGAADLHLRIATALRRRGHPQDLLAVVQHLAAAGDLVPPAELQAAALDAGAQALRAGDHAAAARSFDLALDGDVDDRVALLLRSSAAHHHAGHRETGWERAREAAELAGVGRPVEFARAALEFARHRRYTPNQAEAVAMLRRSIDSIDEHQPLRREVLAACALLEMSMPEPIDLRSLDQLPGGDHDDGDNTQTMVAWNWIHRTATARAMANEALDLARATGDDELVARVAIAWRQTHCAPEYLAPRLETTARSLALARNPSARADAAVACVLDHLEAGQRAQVDRAMAELTGLAAATGDPAVRWRTGQLAAMLAFASGRPSAAERHMNEAFAHGAQASENGRWVVRTVQATLLSLETDADPTPTVDFLATNIGELVYPPIRAGAVLGLVRNGREGVALPYLRELAAHVVDDRDREASWLLTASFTADAVASVGDVELARHLLPVLEPHAASIALDGIGFHCNGCIARPLARLAALVGDEDRAQRLRTVALERDTAAGLRLWTLDDAIDDLAARAATGALDHAEIRVRVAVIADEATERGLTATAGRARALLRPRARIELTDRQRRVLAALADGLTYQAASERLGFSHSTIRHEAMRVYAALGASDRNEAVRLARAAGIVDTE